MPNNNNNDRGNDNRGGDNRSSDTRSGRGFASMSEEERREIASKGGKAAHESGNAHEFDSQEAREAGRKGGQSRGGESRAEEGMEEDQEQSFNE